MIEFIPVESESKDIGYIVPNKRTEYAVGKGIKISVEKAAQLMINGGTIDISQCDRPTKARIYTNKVIDSLIACGKANIKAEDGYKSVRIFSSKGNIKVSTYDGAVKGISVYEIYKLIQHLRFNYLVLNRAFSDIHNIMAKVVAHMTTSDDKYNLVNNTRYDIDGVYKCSGGELSNFVKTYKKYRLGHEYETLIERIQRWNSELSAGYLVIDFDSEQEIYVRIEEGILEEVINEIKQDAKI